MSGRQGADATGRRGGKGTGRVSAGQRAGFRRAAQVRMRRPYPASRPSCPFYAGRPAAEGWVWAARSSLAAPRTAAVCGAGTTLSGACNRAVRR